MTLHVGEMRHHKTHEGPAWFPMPPLGADGAKRRHAEKGLRHDPVLDLAYEERAYRLLGRVERADLLRQHLAARGGTSATALAKLGTKD